MLRRAIAVALAALALLGAAQAEAALCVVAPQRVALTDGQGNELLSGEGVEALFEVRAGALYAAGRKGAYRLYDGTGHLLGKTVFGMIDDAGDALVYRQGGLYGAMDAAGSVLLRPRWTQLVWDGAGGWLALDGDPLDDLPDEVIHLDGSGAARRTGVATASGLAPVEGGRMPYMDGAGRWGAVNAFGEATVDAEWLGVGPFKSGVAIVSGPKGFGLIGADGGVLLEHEWEWMDRSDAMLAAMNGDGVEVYAPDGSRCLFSIPGAWREAALAGDCLWVSDAAHSRLYGADGALLYEGAPGTTFAAGAGGQVIASDGAWGEACQWLIDPDGSAASGRFQQLLPLGEGRYAWLELDGIEYYSAELEAIQKSWDYTNPRYGLMDGAGNVLLPAQYREIRALGPDRLLLITDEAATLADRDGVAIRTWR